MDNITDVIHGTEKFMLISVADREILTERFTSLKDAQAQMHTEMIQWGRVQEEIFEAEEYDGGYDYGFSELGGWANDGINHADYDWLIVEL